MKLLKFRPVFFLITLLSCINFVNATDLIRYAYSESHPDPKQSYFVDLLTIVLETSKEKYGTYQLQPVAIEMGQGRTSMMLQRGELVDIAWRMTSKNLEKELQAIYFPILKGLMGHRIFIIRKNERHLFSRKTSLDNLKKFHLGQGHDWPDTDILLANGFNVIAGYDIYLLEMLKKNRFHYFPRALHEPWIEIINEPSLTIEENLMFKYPAPIFFFVNKHNNHLQKRLSFGLTQLINSGEFESFFLNHSLTSGILAKANVNNRTIFELKNPLLSKKTKKLLLDKRLWVNTK